MQGIRDCLAFKCLADDDGAEDEAVQRYEGDRRRAALTGVILSFNKQGFK